MPSNSRRGTFVAHAHEVSSNKQVFEFINPFVFLQFGMGASDKLISGSRGVVESNFSRSEFSKPILFEPFLTPNDFYGALVNPLLEFGKQSHVYELPEQSLPLVKELITSKPSGALELASKQYVFLVLVSLIQKFYKSSINSSSKTAEQINKTQSSYSSSNEKKSLCYN